MIDLYSCISLGYVTQSPQAGKCPKEMLPSIKFIRHVNLVVPFADCDQLLLREDVHPAARRVSKAVQGQSHGHQ